LVATAGFGAGFGALGEDDEEYFEPEASATFWIIDLGERSDSDLAVTWTWYP
jgi:hypothetical protein